MAGILAGMRYVILSLFVVVPAAELAVLLAVESRIGWPASIGVILVTGVLGAFLVRRQGSNAFRTIQDTFQAGIFPGREMAHGALIMVGGAFLLTPGFVTDLVGFSLMVPAVREVIRVRAASLARERTLW